MSTLVPRYTAEEVRRFPDDHLRYEVIRGELVVTPAPGTVHQRAVLELARRLQEYLKTHVIGEALPAPFEVEFTEDSAVQPDILVILDPQRDRLTAARLYGPPALIVEVVSYSSKRTDRLHKRRLYSEEGVQILDRRQRGPPHRALATRRHERRDRYPSPSLAARRVAPRTDHRARRAVSRRVDGTGERAPVTSGERGAGSRLFCPPAPCPPAPCSWSGEEW